MYPQKNFVHKALFIYNRQIPTSVILNFNELNVQIHGFIDLFLTFEKFNKPIMKRLIILSCLAVLALSISAKNYSVQSPSGKLEIKVSVEEKTLYSVLLHGTEIISPSEVHLILSGGEVWGENAKVKKAITTSESKKIQPVVQRKYASIQDEYNQLTLNFKGYTLQFRAYDEGAAWRWISE